MNLTMNCPPPATGSKMKIKILDKKQKAVESFQTLGKIHKKEEEKNTKFSFR